MVDLCGDRNTVLYLQFADPVLGVLTRPTP
jgi:hypothetical protein